MIALQTFLAEVNKEYSSLAVLGYTASILQCTSDTVGISTFGCYTGVALFMR